MKYITSLILFVLSFSTLAADFKVLKFVAEQKLAAFSLSDGLVTDFKVGQSLKLNESGGNSCILTITKIVPDKSLLFMNSEMY